MVSEWDKPLPRGIESIRISHTRTDTCPVPSSGIEPTNYNAIVQLQIIMAKSKGQAYHDRRLVSGRRNEVETNATLNPQPSRSYAPFVWRAQS